MKKILILTSGKKSKLTSFKLIKLDKDIDLETASFSDIWFSSDRSGIYLKTGESVSEFDIIYFRFVGKALEAASLVSEYAKKNGVQIVDRIYSNSHIFPVTQSKAMEMKALMDTGISIPKTIFGNLDEIRKKALEAFGFPFVVKSTSGRKGREVYSPKNAEELNKLIKSLKVQEKSGKNYFAQEFINAERRIRIMIVGSSAVGAISQLTKWRKRVSGYTPSENEKKISGYNPSAGEVKLAIEAASAVGVDISGVDILKDEKTRKNYVIEVNAAPSWKLVKKYSQVNVERKIVDFLVSLISGKEDGNIKNYERNFKKYGVDAKSLSWKTKGAAHQRFRVFWKYIDFNNKKVLDVGCGFGELGKFLLRRYKGVDYAGIDIIPEFISEAKKLLPEGKFEVKDYLKDEIEGKFDVVVASGILNSNVNNNMEYRKRGIKKLFDLTQKILAFNMLGGSATFVNKKESNVWHADSIEILKYCMSLTRRVVLIQNYHPRDFTIIMHKLGKKV